MYILAENPLLSDPDIGHLEKAAAEADVRLGLDGDGGVPRR